jgi:hypothetical protein
MATERGVSQRTIKVEFQPTRRQQERLQGMLRATKDCYNTLVKYVKYLQQNHHSIRACRLLAAQGLSCPLNQKPKSGEHTGHENALVPNS